jgi:hypothetical protein
MKKTMIGVLQIDLMKKKSSFELGPEVKVDFRAFFRSKAGLRRSWRRDRDRHGDPSIIKRVEVSSRDAPTTLSSSRPTGRSSRERCGDLIRSTTPRPRAPQDICRRRLHGDAGGGSRAAAMSSVP